jgi:hypothetical protein
MEKSTYFLVHNHRFGSDIHLFKSSEDHTGFYNEESDNSDIQHIVDKLNIDVEYDRGEMIDIAPMENNEIVDVDES